MKPRIVVDTNLWIRALLGGPATLPVLEAWRAGKFFVLISQPLLDELETVAQRPRLSRHITQSWQLLSAATLTPLFLATATCGLTTTYDRRCWTTA